MWKQRLVHLATFASLGLKDTQLLTAKELCLLQASADACHGALQQMHLPVQRNSEPASPARLAAAASCLLTPILQLLGTEGISYQLTDGKSPVHQLLPTPIITCCTVG
jgi:hypothetical protein